MSGKAPNMTLLSKLYEPLSGLCDKGTVHSYINVYASLFEPLRQEAVTVIEIGVEFGGSLALWTRYFSHPDSLVYGVDVVDRRVISSPATLVLGDASTEGVASLLPACDIVIDDGSHELADQTRSFSLLWPKLRRGGIYVIEDIQGNHELKKLTLWHPQLELVDLRAVKSRYDNVLLVGKK